MSLSELGNVAYLSTDYANFDLDPSHVAPWENGLRTDLSEATQHGRGNYEWWYASSQFDNGEGSLIAVFHTKPTYAVDEPMAPYVSVSINRIGKEPIERRIRVDADAFTASRENCDVRIGNNYLQQHDGHGVENNGL